MYEGTRTFIDHAAAAFERRGFVAEVVDLQGPADPLAPLLVSAASGPTAMVYSINILGEAHDAYGRSLSQIFDAPHVVWHVDYVLSQEARLAQTPRETALLLVDPTQVDAVNAIYGSERWNTVTFCPHAAVGQAAPAAPDSETFAAERPIGMLWSGSLQKTKVRPWAD